MGELIQFPELKDTNEPDAADWWKSSYEHAKNDLELETDEAVDDYLHTKFGNSSQEESSSIDS